MSCLTYLAALRHPLEVRQNMPMSIPVPALFESLEALGESAMAKTDLQPLAAAASCNGVSGVQAHPKGFEKLGYGSWQPRRSVPG
jgi:hypothetical protein